MELHRRDALKFLLAGAAVIKLPASGAAQEPPLSISLGNGFRVHCLANDSGYVKAALVLRSDAILNDRGLAHLMEHTSFAGAAGTHEAHAIADMYKAYIQDSNAWTWPGVIRWDASFLPEYLPRALNLLAVTSLDQKFDQETVKIQARVVLQELYLSKFDAEGAAQKKFETALYGKLHPYARDTLDEEIAEASTAPDKLCERLRRHASGLRLPANMDLFLAGELEPRSIGPLIEEHFGRYAFAQGPVLELPPVGVTRAYKGLKAPSHTLTRPLSKVKIAWNTGVRVVDTEARVLLALSEYLNTTLFDRLREKDGDTYTPEASFEPDGCSGVFTITISSTRDPEHVERKIFETIEALRSDIDAQEIDRFRDREELKRRKAARDNEKIVERMVTRVTEGACADDLDVKSVTREEMLNVARKHLPSHHKAYVRLALRGQ